MSALISLCMIVKDEEACLARCLDSVRDVVNEIVIVDTGSHDNTVSIAQSYGAKIFYHAWDDNFSAARNVSLDQATGEWIFILDADEVLAQESKASFRALAKNSDMLGYYVLMQLHPGWTEGRRLSFFRNLPALRYSGIFHEELSISEPLLEKAAALLAETDSDIHRYTHYLGRYLLCLYRLQYLSEKGLPLERMMLECEQAISLFPSSPLFYYEAAKIFYKLKSYDKAISYFQRCISLGEDGTWDRITIFPKDILGLKSFEGLGYCYFKKRNYGDALRYFEMSYGLHEDNRIKAMIHASRTLQNRSGKGHSLSASGS
jgi:glycosyltransferase involved in cell wall biosynthesis